jgi:glyoxylase-like metal-dependent hydrolase (beta-lactamase superfamily II)
MSRIEEIAMRWKIGNVTVTRVVETELPTPGTVVLPDAVPENVAKIPWLAPHFVQPDGSFVLSIHALVVESQGKKIVVDTCLGNDKKRTMMPDWNMRNGPFLQQLTDAGHPRESIDTVVCTHLHIDHVGWNTMLVNGRWVPTFPKARYLIGRKEWDFWRSEPENPEEPIMSDSVKPIIDAGLADLVEADHKLTSEVWLEPTHGHTPGHVSVRISSAGEDAVITGDMMHHPSQIAKPEWASNFDWDQAKGRETRRAAIERWANGGYLVIGTHFASPTAGRIVRDGNAWRLAV